MPTLAVIFDFDGVLANTEELHYRAFTQVFEPRGWALDLSEYYERYMGFDDRGLVVEYARDRAIDVPADVLHTLIASKAQAFGELLSTGEVLYPGAREIVRQLAGEFRLAIASGALHEEIVTILGAGRLLDYFEVIVGADDVAASKPAPDSYLAAAAALGVHPSACVAVEDSLWGLRAARAAGMRAIAVTTTSPASALAGAERILAGVHELTIEILRGA
jgi:beta-phosphoglucomutase